MGLDSLSEWKSKELLASYGIVVSDEELVQPAAAAVKAAQRIGFPVVM